MPPKSLHGIDRDVYQIIRKLEDDHERNNSDKDGSKPLKFTISGVYDSIKRSNSSLGRLKKRPLEDSIERVLRIRKEERKEEDEEEALEEASMDSPKPKERDYFMLNKQMTKSWDVPRNHLGTPPEASNICGTAPRVDTTAGSTTVERQPNGEARSKRRKYEKPKEDRTPPSDVSLLDLGGMDDAIRVLAESVTFPMRFPEICLENDLEATRGVLLHGPPGCGKTMLANAYAASLGVAYIPVSAPSLVAGMSGESEKKIRELYDEAKSLAPCLIFIDEIDAIMGKRENAQREMEKRIVAQMLTCMDDLAPQKLGGKFVVTLAATNRPDSIDPALRRAGRFNREISLGIPNEASREAILRKMLCNSKVSSDFDYKLIAKRTPGFVGADLKDVVSVAKNEMVRATMSELAYAGSEEMDLDPELDVDLEPNVNPDQNISPGLRLHLSIMSAPTEAVSKDKLMLTMEHMLSAIEKVQPSSKREGFTTIPDTTWAHIGALHDVRKQLMLSIVKPIQSPERFINKGLEAPSGVLLWGPPGCGKTLLAKAVANESKANFISVKGPELLNKYVGESERSVRQVFSRARSSAPCILFFDELDALVPRRDGSGSDASARVVNQLLTELDGINSRLGVYVVGATNRPDMIDPAILRPGRLGTNIFVDLPDADGRVDILKTRMRRLLPSYTDHDTLEAVARDPRCTGFSGADIDNLHVAAGQAAVERADVSGPDVLTPEDWEAALRKIKPSVSLGHSTKFRELKDLGWD
ncbi:AAA-domain-containing protein [Annulohypoxylon truncatum]|uniref:AAA-domain-containing protein n=1 Tax=Annulohypoxylon truncatum TaxID=327061 RepID=UPI0020077F72|nr:AAA-domain-containing protein [Annulohypoxylon truncatum]KAI1210319.1 AAA-domain-containing protein [Annulohypoxylon truncatum]